MNALTERDMGVHVPVLGWILIALHGLSLLIAGFLFILLVGVGLAVGDAEASRILTVVGVLVSGFLALLALPGVVAGAALLARKSWGRILALIVALLGILNFPLGTIVSIYAFWVLLQDAAPAYFQASTASRARP